jgi:hypothetical protein
MQEYYSGLGRRTAVPLRANAASIAAFGPGPAARNESTATSYSDVYAPTPQNVHRLTNLKKLWLTTKLFLDIAYRTL